MRASGRRKGKSTAGGISETGGVRDVPAAPATPQSLAGIVAHAFARLGLAQRAGVLQRLLQPVGPMALAVLGGGVFAKYVLQARGPQITLSLEDVARITSRHIVELVRYVEQSNPLLLQELVAALARDPKLMAALGASLAAIALRQIRSREVVEIAVQREPAGPRENGVE